MSAETEIDRKILDFLGRNGKSTALTISKEFGLNRSTVNKHLYNLKRSKQVSGTNETPPVWDLMEKRSEIKQTLKPEPKSPARRDTCEEKHVRDLLRSGGLKAHLIAKELGQPTKTIKKQLYSMEKEGKVQKYAKTSMWTLNEKESHESYPQERPGTNSRLSQCFDVITELGKGGFGCVYKVKHKYDDKIYAVKKVVLTGKADSEVKALAMLDHPNIVRYLTCWSDSENCTSTQERSKVSKKSGSSSDVVTFERSGCEENDDDDDDDDDDDIDDDDDDDDDDDISDDVTSGMASLGVTADKTYLLIQMEFCEGGTLTAWIKDRNLMNKHRNTEEINKVFHEIISGVEYIHSNNLIHRDLKPDNILFGTDGKVKIGDFGLVAAQTTDSGDPIERSKRRGTLQYMSPEQENKMNYDEKTDIFPLGLVWFEMLWILSTGMERVKLWQDLRNQRFPDGFCDSYTNESKFIKVMLSFTPEDRPHAKDIKEKLEMFFSLDQNLLSQKTI